jgi:hypothetical protein
MVEYQKFLGHPVVTQISEQQFGEFRQFRVARILASKERKAVAAQKRTEIAPSNNTSFSKGEIVFRP